MTYSKPNKRICFITETDLGSPQITGATINDLRILRLLKKFGDVDIVYLRKHRHRNVWGYLPIFLMQILGSLFKPYQIYFTRSTIASFIITSLRPLGTRKVKLVHQTFSVPLASAEIEYLEINIVESLIRFKLYDFFEKKALPRVDAVTTVSNEYVRALVKIGVMPSKIYIVPFSVEDDFFNQPLKSSSEMFTFCYIGGFHFYHGLVPLVEASELILKTRKNINLILVGDGPLRPKLKREVERRKLIGKVKFLGKVPHSHLPSLLSKVDCIISLIRKCGISISLLEAAASGKAIVAFTPDSALKRYFKHRKNIYFVNVLSPRAIADAMQIIYRNSNLRNTLAKGARETVQQHFRERIVLQHLQELFKKVYDED